MALTINRAIQSIDELIDLVQNELPKAVVSVAIGMKSNIQDRIQETGISATGRKLPEYSEEYKLVKQGKGQPTSHVSLTDTGTMWGQTGLTSSDKGEKFFVKIGGQTPSAKDKLRWNSERYGDILRPNLAERQEALNIIDSRLQAMVNAAFS